MTQLNSYACTLVPTVFLRNRETEFELQFRFSCTHVIGKRNSRFRFRFPTTLKMEFEPCILSQNSNIHFRFSSFVFVRY